MNIIDLGAEHMRLFACCLEDWSDEVREAGDRRACWVSAIAKWGSSDALFVDGKAVRTGPPPSYEKIRSIIAKRTQR